MGEQVAKALAAWANAPMHIKAMAGAYVGPLLDAVSQTDQRVSRLESAMDFVMKKMGK